jgi:hypothetical protein
MNGEVRLRHTASVDGPVGHEEGVSMWRFLGSFE